MILLIFTSDICFCILPTVFSCPGNSSYSRKFYTNRTFLCDQQVIYKYKRRVLFTKKLTSKVQYLIQNLLMSETYYNWGLQLHHQTCQVYYMTHSFVKNNFAFFILTTKLLQKMHLGITKTKDDNDVW